MFSEMIKNVRIGLVIVGELKKIQYIKMSSQIPKEGGGMPSRLSKLCPKIPCPNKIWRINRLSRLETFSDLVGNVDRRSTMLKFDIFSFLLAWSCNHTVLLGRVLKFLSEFRTTSCCPLQDQSSRRIKELVQHNLCLVSYLSNQQLWGIELQPRDTWLLLYGSNVCLVQWDTPHASKTLVSQRHQHQRLG